MSLYRKDLTEEQSQIFTLLKRDFKANKPCVVCGNKLKSNRMTIDHIVRVAEGSDIFDIDNWQVLCTPCHRKKSDEEALRDRVQGNSDILTT